MDLRKWFLIQRQTHAFITLDILSGKAKPHYHEHYDDKKCLSKRSRLTHFKKWHNLRCLKLSSQKLSNNQKAVELFLEKLLDKIGLNISSQQTSNADESALFWKMLPA